MPAIKTIPKALDDLAAATATRRAKRAEADQADRAFESAIQDARRAGAGIKSLVTITGLSRNRVYAHLGDTKPIDHPANTEAPA